jgi:hypothetical protein
MEYRRGEHHTLFIADCGTIGEFLFADKFAGNLIGRKAGCAAQFCIAIK